MAKSFMCLLKKENVLEFFYFYWVFFKNIFIIFNFHIKHHIAEWLLKLNAGKIKQNLN